MVTYRQATRDELNLAIAWAAEEGWNPGRHDADSFWAADPGGFVCAERNGEVIATGSIVSYDGTFGFMGFFIVRPDLRGQGIGRRFWTWRRDRLRERLDADASIGMDGVFTMQPFYARGGFEFTHRNLRMEGIGRATTPDPGLVTLSQLPLHDVFTCDRQHFGFARPEFLRRWINPPGGLALGVNQGDALTGFGVARPCQTGYKIGPLFAPDFGTADRLFQALSSHAAGQPVFLDIPENNPNAVRLAAAHGLTEVFGCARMYLGQPPDLPWRNIYGVTTFELG